MPCKLSRRWNCLLPGFKILRLEYETRVQQAYMDIGQKLAPSEYLWYCSLVLLFSFGRAIVFRNLPIQTLDLVKAVHRERQVLIASVHEFETVCTSSSHLLEMLGLYPLIHKIVEINNFKPLDHFLHVLYGLVNSLFKAVLAPTSKC